MSIIDFSEEQSMLLETANEFCRENSTMSVVRAQIDKDESIDAELWSRIVELGWLGVSIPEAYGGLGMGLAGACPIVESMGKYLMGSPYTSCILGSEAMLSCASEEQKNEWLPKIVEGAVATIALTEEDGNWRLEEISSRAEKDGESLVLSGSKCFVLDAPMADLFIISVVLEGEPRFVFATGDQVDAGRLMRENVIDETRRSYRLELDGLVIPESQLLEGADFSRIEMAAMLMLVAEMSGGLSGVLHVIIDYLTTRKQFDKYIGSYQSLKHPTVQILLSQEACRSHLYHAATQITENSADAISAIRMAKAQGAEAFSFAGDRAVQFHGGFGFTYECDAQLFLRRALWCQYQFGDSAYHNELLAPLLLDEVV